MILTLSISAQAEAKLKEKAAAAGVDVETYAIRHLELVACRTESPKDVSGSVAEKFAASGISDDQLIADITAAQVEYRAAKHKKPA